jgi:hypothetical protein
MLTALGSDPPWPDPENQSTADEGRSSVGTGGKRTGIAVDSRGHNGGQRGRQLAGATSAKGDKPSADRCQFGYHRRRGARRI